MNQESGWPDLALSRESSDSPDSPDLPDSPTHQTHQTRQTHQTHQTRQTHQNSKLMDQDSGWPGQLGQSEQASPWK